MSEERASVCLCLTGRTLGDDLAALERYRPFVDMVELRADCLDPGEKFLIRDFPEKAGLPCILTVRRKIDGGYFEDGEGVRLVMFAKALSYASADRLANFAYVDLEDDFHVPAVEDACRTFGTRIIRSRHYPEGMPGDLDAAWAAVSEMQDEIPKLAVTPGSSADLARLISWSQGLPRGERIVIGMGDFGHPSRLLPGRFGSCLAYTSAYGEGLLDATPGQVDPETYRKVYRGAETGPDADLYALVGGKSVLGSFSPMLHNAAFREAGMDAVYVPFPSDDAVSFMKCLDLLGARGASVTVPFKEDVLPFLETKSTDVGQIGACNTLHRTATGWAGYNTDADGFERSALEFLGREDFRDLRVTLVGAGGAAKSVAASLFRKGAKCVILNRNLSKARDLARKYGFAWGPLDDRSIDLVYEHSDLVVQATSIGMEGGPQGDPLEWYEFKGAEAVFDLVYRPVRTEFLERAEAAGCRILNGAMMLRYQAAGQYRVWTRKTVPDVYYT